MTTEKKSIFAQVLERLETEVEFSGNGPGASISDSLLAQLIEMAMSNPLYHVEEFHTVYGHPISYKLNFDDEVLYELRRELLREEYEDELLPAFVDRDPVEITDALCDLIYVAIGAMLALGLPARLGMNEVHASNMSKLDEDGKPIVREDGKILKGPGYFKPKWAEVFQQFTKAKGRV